MGEIDVVMPNSLWRDLPNRALLRPREVAELFGESRSSIYGRISRGEFDGSTAVRLRVEQNQLVRVFA